MIHEEICTYEVCKLAKEKGFDEPTLYAYDEESRRLARLRYCVKRNSRTEGLVTLAAPTQSLLQRWLREEKGVCISVEAYPTYATKNNILYSWAIKYRSSGHSMECQQSFDTFSTYEKALEEALEFALKELV